MVVATANGFIWMFAAKMIRHLFTDKTAEARAISGNSQADIVDLIKSYVHTGPGLTDNVFLRHT